MLIEKNFECLCRDALAIDNIMSDEEKFSQVLSELIDLHIERIEKPKTNAGYFAMEMSSLYGKDVILMKEGIPESGSIALVYWKDWKKFSLIKYKNARATYVLVNFDFEINVTEIMIDKFYRILNKNDITFLLTI